MSDAVHNLRRMEQQFLTSGSPTGMVAVIGEARQEIERLRAAMAEAMDEIECERQESDRLREALKALVNAIDASPRRLPSGPGPQEIGAQMRSMIYRVQGNAVENARAALGDDQ